MIALAKFTEHETYLRIELTAAGIEEVKEWDLSDARGDIGMFLDVCEYQLCSGWRNVRPEMVGDLRDEAYLVFSQDYFFPDENSDEGMVVGTAYGFDRYALAGYMDTLIEFGHIDFQRHDYLAPDEMKAAVEAWQAATK